MFYAVIFFTVILLILIYFDVRKPRNYPPGPRWCPVLGNALQISKLRIKYGMFCKAVKELDRIYGKYGVIGLKIGKDKLVICNNTESIREMMTNEDLDGRPTGPFYETRTWGSRKGILLTDEEFWQEQRRFLVRHLKEFGFARRGAIAIIQNEAQYLMKDVNKMINNQIKQEKQQPGNENSGALIEMSGLFQIYILNTLWSMMAGIRYDRDDHEVQHLLGLFAELFRNIDMIGCLFSHFPILQVFAPHLSGYSYFLDIHRRVYDFLGKEIEKHKRNFSPLNEPRDLIDTYLQVLAQTEPIGSSFSEKQLLAICLDMFLAGSETTTKTLGFAFLYIIRESEIQKKIQNELDSVLGRERFPSWDDRINLPYCEATVYEAIRMFMGNTFGIPHRALRNTRLCGYDIPKDTMVVGCFTGMLMNPEYVDEPEKFKPERFLRENKISIPEFYTPFGIGRHRCMGELLAKQNLFLFTTTLLQNFSFTIPDGYPLPDTRPQDGATASVRPYTALIEAR